MKFYLLVIAFCISTKVSGQNKCRIVSDSIKIEYNIIEDSNHFNEEITIKNLSKKSIYLPKIENKKTHFFILGDTLTSYFGIMFSLLGYPNLSGRVELIKVLPNKEYKFKVEILKNKKAIVKYYYGFDFIEEDKSFKKYTENNILYIEVSDYVENRKGLIVNYE